MSVHTYDYDRPDSLGRYFAAALVTHAAVAALLIVAGLFNLKDNWGDQHASSGSVGVSMVKTIPIPRREGPKNPLANDTKEIAPQEVTPVKPKAQAQTPEPKAIPIPDRVQKPKKTTPHPQTPTVFKPQEYQANQVYSKTPQSTNSPLYGMQGAGGIDIGPASDLGNRFGAYVQLMRDRISQHWVTADVSARPQQKCAVSFTIARNGAVSNVQLTQPSGSYLLDTSARRAIVDANPLPPLPQQYEKSEVTVELWFQLKQ